MPSERGGLRGMGNFGVGGVYVCPFGLLDRI